MTEFIKKSELDNQWYHIDATDIVVGRLAAEISKILRRTFVFVPKHWYVYQGMAQNAHDMWPHTAKLILGV